MINAPSQSGNNLVNVMHMCFSRGTVQPDKSYDARSGASLAGSDEIYLPLDNTSTSKSLFHFAIILHLINISWYVPGCIYICTNTHLHTYTHTYPVGC